MQKQYKDYSKLYTCEYKLQTHSRCKSNRTTRASNDHRNRYVSIDRIRNAPIPIHRVIDISISVITTANNRNINVKNNPFINTSITLFTIIIRNPTIGINIHILITVNKSIHTRSLSVYSICRYQTLRITVARPPRSIYKACDFTYNSNISYRHTRYVKAIERLEQAITILCT